MVRFGVIWPLLLLVAPASAERWYYPDETDLHAPLNDALRLGDSIVIGLESSAHLPTHPDAITGRWLSRRPAVAKLTLKAQSNTLKVSQEFHDRPGIQWAHPDFMIDLTLHALPDDPYVASQWHLENTGQTGAPGVDINAELAWELSTGQGQLISIIDSGVDLDHPDLTGFSGADYVDGDNDNFPADGNSHGTACAGLAASIGDNAEGGAGVAYNAEIYGVRLLGGETSMSDTYSAIITSIDAGASVLSNSWGFTTSCDGYSLPALYIKALDYAEEDGRGGLGSVVLQAAGNDNCDISHDGILAYETVVAVAALSANDDKESYSSYGTPIDIAAPSGGLITTDIVGDAGYGSYQNNPNYTGGMSGTSAATPVAAGVFALMFAVNDRLTAADARDIVCQTATRNDILDADFDESGWSPYFGCGRIDAGAAVHAVANVAPEAPLSTMPVDTVYEDRIWLDWSAATDEDQDRLDYRVKWWTNENGVAEAIVNGTSLEVTDSASFGDILNWQVQAIDLWGNGPWSDRYSLTVTARPKATPPEVPAGACQAATKGVWWLGILVLFRRNHRQIGAKPTALDFSARSN
jgi:subtilisin family serine protease